MKDPHIYIALWEKYRPVILNQMRLAINEPQSYSLSKHEFEAVGEKRKTNFTFNLELNKSSVKNNIGGTAVSKDLYEVLKKSKTAGELMNDHHFKISLDKNFNLKTQVLTEPAAV